MRGWTGTFASVALAAMAVGGCGDGKTEGVVRVATEAAYRPFEFVQRDGSLAGFDIDLINAIAKAGGFAVRIKNLPWDGMLTGLQEGRYDAVISALSITDERKKNLLFSDPYLASGLIIAVQKKTTDINSLADLKGKTIAVQINTTGHNKAKQVEAASITRFDSIELALQDLAAGRADAVINDEPVTAFYIKQLTSLKMVGKKLTSESYGIALRKGDTALAAKVNAGLTRVRESGEYDKIVKRWLSSE